jgi:hypothetical protein
MILNDQGEIVWWHALPFGQISRAALSNDGKFLYVRDSNELVQGPGQAARIAMDGSSVDTPTITRRCMHQPRGDKTVSFELWFAWHGGETPRALERRHSVERASSREPTRWRGAA